MFRWNKRYMFLIAVVCSLGLTGVMACSDDDEDQDTLYDRLGKDTNILKVVQDFRTRVVADASINGFFANANVSRLDNCLVKQIGSVTGGPQTYPAEGEPADADGCRNMTESHTGMNLSNQDFDTLAQHLVDALEAAGVTEDDVTTIVQTITPIKQIIVGI